jgi:hypothetical protein
VYENERIWNFQASHHFQRRVKADSSFNSRKEEGHQLVLDRISMGSQEVVRPAPGLLLRRGLIIIIVYPFCA